MLAECLSPFSLAAPGERAELRDRLDAAESGRPGGGRRSDHDNEAATRVVLVAACCVFDCSDEWRAPGRERAGSQPKKPDTSKMTWTVSALEPVQYMKSRYLPVLSWTITPLALLSRSGKLRVEVRGWLPLSSAGPTLT
jgi:hypothetical protein